MVVCDEFKYCSTRYLINNNSNNNEKGFNYSNSIHAITYS